MKGVASTARFSHSGSGPHGRPYAVQMPAPAALAARSGRQTTAHSQEGRNAPPEA